MCKVREDFYSLNKLYEIVGGIIDFNILRGYYGLVCLYNISLSIILFKVKVIRRLD